VRLLLRLDRRGRLRFAPLGGTTFRALVPASERASLPDSLLLRLPDGRLLVRSAAVRAALRLTGASGLLLAAFAAVVPTRIADAVYDQVARVRRRLFAPQSESCPRVSAERRARLLD